MWRLPNNKGVEPGVALTFDHIGVNSCDRIWTATVLLSVEAVLLHGCPVSRDFFLLHMRTTQHSNTTTFIRKYCRIDFLAIRNPFALTLHGYERTITWSRGDIEGRVKTLSQFTAAYGGNA